LRRELRLRRPPAWMVLALILVVVGTWIPLAVIYRARKRNSPLPRIHLIQDMDKQPRRGPQTSHSWFVDGRAMRQPVSGTIPRGPLRSSPEFRGYRLRRDADSGAESPEFLTEIPAIWAGDPSLSARGQDRFTIYCALCHGPGGMGDGPIHQRAVELKEPKWVPATNLMTQEIRDRKDGQLFQAITDGVRNMPPYRAQIHPRDRWAIVAFLRDLQNRTPVAPSATTANTAAPSAAQ
jgi:mono/diheme cytochrome c family protein